VEGNWNRPSTNFGLKVALEALGTEVSYWGLLHNPGMGRSPRNEAKC